MNWHWILAAGCALLGAADVLIYFKTAPERRAKVLHGRVNLHLTLMILGAAILILAALRVILLLTRG